MARLMEQWMDVDLAGPHRNIALRLVPRVAARVLYCRHAASEACAEVDMTTRTEAASEVRKVLQSVRDRLAMPGGAKVNEATTRAHFISPLLVALGYQSIDDVLFEYYLPDGKQFLDYRLVVDGKPRVAVEAKALDVPLTDQHAAQAVSYASVLGDEWAVVTNARHWRLYHAFAQAPLADKLILTADLVGGGVRRPVRQHVRAALAREQGGVRDGRRSGLMAGVAATRPPVARCADRPGVARDQVHPQAARRSGRRGDGGASGVVAEGTTGYPGRRSAEARAAGGRPTGDLR